MKSFFGVGLVLLVLSSIPAYLTHLWWSLSGLFMGKIDQINEAAIAFLGVLMPPIGVLHGFYLWFS